MITMVTGGSGSGKSAYAESIVVASGKPNPIYLATMMVWDAEGVARVARHREMRANKGFITVECPVDLGQVSVPTGGIFLLEDLSNLAANEHFGANPDHAVERILEGIWKLSQRGHLVIVTNELWSDGCVYPPETQGYLSLLATLNQTISAHATTVVEVCCGIPITWKAGVAS